MKLFKNIKAIENKKKGESIIYSNIISAQQLAI